MFDFAGLGAMGFSLPAALGATATNPDIPVIDIEGDGSFIMNVRARGEKIPHLSCNNVLK
jgi:thiamine pyrophosphate-dependent acetolactate synthase large subunit-like protein